MITQAERIARVEVEIKAVNDVLIEHKDETQKRFVEVNGQFNSVNTKLDELLALRNKGAGVFWMVSSLMGVGLVGGVASLFRWIAGHP